MLNVFKDFAEKLSRIGKYYGIEKSESDSEAAFLNYTEKKRVISNLRRTLIFAMFLILYLLIVLITIPLKIVNVTIPLLMMLIFGIVMLTAFVGVCVILYEKIDTESLGISKRDRQKFQVVYTFFWTLYYGILIFCEFAYKNQIVGIMVWLPIMIVGLLVPVFSLQEGTIPMTLAISSLGLLFFNSGYAIKELAVAVPVIIIVVCVVDINHVERVNGFYQEARIYGESTASRRRLGNVFEEVYDMAFELDFGRNECQILRNNDAYSLKFDSEVVGLDKFRSSMMELIHPDDVHIASKVLDRDYIENEIVIEGRSQIYVELRILTSREEYEWISVLLSCEKQIDETYVSNDLLLYLVQNIEERKKNENRLRLEAERDPLTQLYNKMTTRSLIEECFEKNPSAQHALIIIDIDNFKTINDTRGHAVGDQILLAFANELSRNFRESDILGRAGGDEFVLLIKNIQSIALVCDKLQQLTSAFKKYGIDNGFPGRLSTSIGVAIFGKDGSTYEELFKRADAALYEAKRNGKDQYKFSITRS